MDQVTTLDASTDAKLTPDSTDAARMVRKAKNDLTKKEVFSGLFERTLSRFSNTVNKTSENRLIRRSNVDVKGKQSQGMLKPDETIIPVPVVDENVTRELPKHLAFLKQSRRLAIFEPQDLRLRTSPQFNVGTLESEFTRVMQYDDWELDYVRWLDGRAVHGWSWARIRYSPDLPGAVRVEHVRQDYLFFDTAVQDVQHSPMVAQLHLANVVRLQEFAEKFGFDQDATDKFEDHLRAQSNSNDNESVNFARQPVYMYEVFFKQDGIVYIAWWAKEINSFLSKPTPFFNGIQEEVTAAPTIDPLNPMMGGDPIASWVDSPETEYPFVPFYNEVTEDATIIEHRGAAIKDYYMQEASTTVLSSLVNACSRAANYMIVPDQTGDMGVAPKQLTLKIENGKIWNQKVSFISTPWPDSAMFKVLDTLSTRNAESKADIAWAVNNRQDSRKTAAEVQAAQSQSSQLNSTAVLYFSMALRQVYTKAWRIVQNVALRGEIQFLLTPEGVNNIPVIKEKYRLRTAGDVDYVARQERIAAMRLDWPVIQTTGAAVTFLSEYLKLQYPDSADNYIAAIQAAMQEQNQAVQVVQKLGAALQAAVMSPDGKLKPEFQADAPALQQLQQLVQQFIQNAQQPPGSAAAGAAGSSPQTGAPAVAGQQ